MKQIVGSLFVVLLFILLAISEVSACSMVPTSIKLVDGEKNCDLFPHWYFTIADDGYTQVWHSTEVGNSNIGELCPDFSLTEENKGIIFDFVGKLRSDYGYTNIEKQSDDEYSNFLKEINEINSQICDCQKIVLHGRNGSWTAYTNDFKESCSFSTACYQPPFFCPNSGYFDLTLIFIIVAGISIGIILGILLIKRRAK